MSNELPSNDPLDELVRRATGDPAPSPGAADRGMQRLESAMRDASTAARPRRARVGWAQVAAAAAVAGLFVLVGSLVLPARVSALASLASVAETVPPMVATEAAVVYRESDQTSVSAFSAGDLGLEEGGDIACLRNQLLRTWETADQIHEQIVAGPLVFFRPEDEAAFAASPLADLEEPGKTTESTTERTGSDLDARNWSVDPVTLQAEMEAYVSNEPAGTPLSVEVMSLAGNLLRDPRIDAPLRAAVIRVIDDLEDVTVSEVGGTVTASLRFVAPSGADAVVSMDFDEGAHLVREWEVWLDGHEDLGIPPGTVVFDSRHSIPQLVDAVGD